jgi:hypothetical protein
MVHRDDAAVWIADDRHDQGLLARQVGAMLRFLTHTPSQRPSARSRSVRRNARMTGIAKTDSLRPGRIGQEAYSSHRNGAGDAPKS